MKIFISCAHDDEELARDLAKHLVDANHDVWYAGGRILPGDDPGSSTGNALLTSDAMIVLVSRASMRSAWVQREIAVALGARNYAGRIIPVILEAGDEAPWILRTLQSVRSVNDSGEVSRQIMKQLEQANN